MHRLYHSAEGEKKETTNKSGGSFGHKIYTQLDERCISYACHLLSVAVFLIAIAFLIDGLSVDMNTLAPVTSK